MPVINFKQAKKVSLGSKQAEKVYLGDKLVWEENRESFISTSTPFSIASYGRYIDINTITTVIDASRIKRIEIGNLGVVDGSYVRVLGSNSINIRVSIGVVTGNKDIPAGTPIKIYYE